MKEIAPVPSSYRESPHLSFEHTTLSLPGEPETPADFRRALAYLDAITAHFVEFGPLEEKTAFAVAYELSYHNGWHQYKVEQERKAGESAAEYREIRLYHLRALSQRNVQTMAESGEQESEDYRVASFINGLIAEAVAAEEEIERLTSISPVFFSSLHETPETPFLSGWRRLRLISLLPCR